MYNILYTLYIQYTCVCMLVKNDNTINCSVELVTAEGELALNDVYTCTCSLHHTYIYKLYMYIYTYKIINIYTYMY